MFDRFTSKSMQVSKLLSAFILFAFISMGFYMQYGYRPEIKGVSDTAPNLILIPSFETNLTDYFEVQGLGEFNLDVNIRNTGLFSALIKSSTTNANSTFGLSTKKFAIPVLAGKNYDFKAYLLPKNVVNKVEIFIDYYDKNTGYKTGTTTKTSFKGNLDTWSEFVSSGVAPQGTNSAVVNILLTGSGTVWIDDISLSLSTTGSVISTPTPTPTPTATPTITPTPMPSMTMTPSPTPTPDIGGGGGGAGGSTGTGYYPNFKGKYTNESNNGTPKPTAAAITAAGGAQNIPQCPAQMHDNKNWHPLYVPGELITADMAALVTSVDMRKTGCHYVHTHNANPAIVDDIFGPAGSQWGNQSISYPWETFSAGGQTDPMMHENHMKHEGYKYIVERNLPIGRDGTGLNWAPGTNNRITDIRVEYHALGGVKDAVVRLHSYYAEFKVCSKNDASQCGITKFGGWADYGIMHLPYKTAYRPLPSDPEGAASQDINVDPYRAHIKMSDGISIASNPLSTCRTCGNSDLRNNDIWWLWTTSDRYGYDQLGGPFIFVSDDWQGIDPNDPTKESLVCDPRIGKSCRFNSTEHQPATMWSNVPSSMDNNSTDKDPRAGYVSYTGYTDRTGKIVTNCTGIALDCIPVSMEKMPVGYGSWNSPALNFKWQERFKDYDVSPDPVWWVQYPN